MEFEKVITERFSVRKFEERPVSQSDIDKILSAGHLAPTGCNFQPQRILVLNSKETIEKLKKCTKCHFGAPCAMLICYNKNESWKSPYNGALSAPVDASIVTTHMMLMAQNIGVGTCWVMYFDPAAMRKEFCIPDDIVPHALLVMGYPHKDAPIHEFHNTFRPIEETVFYDKF